MLYFDTESIGFYGPTVLIQWAVNDGEIHLHNIWDNPVYKTLDLIEKMVEHKEGVSGYNLSHDSYHINKTYNVLKQLPIMSKPDIYDYHAVEVEDETKDRFCVKPVKCLDFLSIGKKGPFQAVLKQKDIVLKRVPKVLATLLVDELSSKIDIPSIYFSKGKKGYRWDIKELHKGEAEEIAPTDENAIVDPDFVNIRLTFNPSAALKHIIHFITGEECKTLDDLYPLPKPEEYEYFPSYSGWMDVAPAHIRAWSIDADRLKYAKDDVEYLRILDKYFNYPREYDNDSHLAWAIGAMYYRGFAVNVDKVKIKLDKIEKELSKCEINYNSVKQVKKYIQEYCTPLELQAVENTKKETLRSLLAWKEDNPTVAERAENVLRWRQLDDERDLCRKLYAAKRLHVMFKVIGTKSNRMGGGGESYVVSRGSINPQGIKHDAEIRELVLLAFPGMVHCGGDFSGFEVSIADAVYNDPDLRADLIKGKKMHGLFAEAMYGIPYEQIIEYADLGENEEKGWYARGKRGFFGKLYGAHTRKLATVLWLTEEEVEEGIARFFDRYTGVKEAQNRLYENHMALRQPEGIGTAVIWKEPITYNETFLGFRRDFALEYSIIRILYNLSNDLPDEIVEAGKRLKLMRRDRLQTGTGAIRSALYAAAFNMQAQIMRSAGNNEIQSPGGQITKELEGEIWKVQPVGIHKWYVMPFNVHDEIQCPCIPEVVDTVSKIVHDKVESFRPLVPTIKMEWKTGMKDWSEK